MRLAHLSLVLVLAVTLASVSGCRAILGPNPQETGAQATPGATASASPAGRAGAVTAQPTIVPVPGQATLSEVVDRVRPAVVQVTNQQQVQVEQFVAPILATSGIGSGVIYDASGLILTNEHVVSGADSLQVSLPDGRTFPAQVVGTDPVTDLAVLRIDGQSLPVAQLGTSSSLAVGDWVLAIGNALALTGGPTVTTGIVSALDRAIQAPASTSDRGGTPQATRGGRFLINLIQTDAAINPGNSGGPLVNLQAEVVGINTVVAAAANGQGVEGIGFATSIDTARDIADQLVASGRAVHPYLGVQYVSLNPALAARLNLSEQRGAYVLAVDANSPAERANLARGDVIVSADDQPLESESSLARTIEQHRPGDTIPLTIVRDGRRLTVQVTLAQAPSS